MAVHVPRLRQLRPSVGRAEWDSELWRTVRAHAVRAWAIGLPIKQTGTVVGIDLAKENCSFAPPPMPGRCTTRRTPIRIHLPADTPEFSRSKSHSQREVEPAAKSGDQASMRTGRRSYHFIINP